MKWYFLIYGGPPKFENVNRNFKKWQIFSLPSLSLDIFYYKSKKSIELISCPEMLQFFEEAIRGGLSFSNERLCDIRGSNKELMHWDINNLVCSSIKTLCFIYILSWMPKIFFSFLVPRTSNITKVFSLKLTYMAPIQKPPGRTYTCDPHTNAEVKILRRFYIWTILIVWRSTGWIFTIF